jgi:hypothetical protein
VSFDARLTIELISNANSPNEAQNPRIAKATLTNLIPKNPRIIANMNITGMAM